MEQNKYNLFLDDYRIPYDCLGYVHSMGIRPDIYTKNKFKIVKNYEEFVKTIISKGLPDFISFDHDLADEHYTPKDYWDDYDKSKKYQEEQEYKEKTGMDCARWLINYCIDNDFELPNFEAHSMNPVGRNNIINLLSNFKSKYVNK